MKKLITLSALLLTLTAQSKTLHLNGKSYVITRSNPKELADEGYYNQEVWSGNQRIILEISPKGRITGACFKSPNKMGCALWVTIR